MKAGDTGSAGKLCRCGVFLIRGFSGSLEARFDRLPCRETVCAVLGLGSSTGIGGIGGIGSTVPLERVKPEETDAGWDIEFVALLNWDEPDDGPVATVAKLEVDAAEFLLESDWVNVELAALFRRPCNMARRASEKDG